MSKIETNFELLELFNEEEINIVCKNADLTLFLMPIKDSRYSKYAKKLGRLDKKSVLVQTLLPGIAFHLYKKGEEPFRVAVATQLESFRNKFFEAITNCMELPVGIDEIKTYGVKNMSEFYFRLLEISVTDIPVELFFIFLKLHGICISAEFRLEVEKEVEKILQVKQIEDTHKIEVAKALKEQEKKLLAEFEQEKYDLKKHIEDKARIQRELKEKLVFAEQKIQKYENLTQTEKKKQKEEWLSEYEKEFKERKAADEIHWKNLLVEAEQRHEELVSELERKAEQKKTELEIEYSERQRIEEEKLAKESLKWKLQVDKLIESETQLNQQVRALEEQKELLDRHINELESIEEKYFENFEKRIVEKRIDSLIFEKLGYSDGYMREKRETLRISENGADIVLTQPKSYSGNFTYGELVNSIEDFFDDFRDNISMNFDSETEIAGAVLAATANNMSVISIDKVCTNLSEALAALLDLSTPLIISIDSGKGVFKEIVDTINNCESQVICIKGALDMYNENLLIRICEACRGKYLFFSVTNLEKLKMMSKEIMNCAVVIDAEHELKFSTDKNILIGDHYLKPLLPNLSIKKSKGIYNKNFSRLVAGGYLKKVAALEYSNLIQLYIEFTDGNTLGDIIQKAVINACDFPIVDKALKDLLARCEITVPVK